ncbi:Electron transfer flavoprotein alpha-subunit [Pichia californica]|uniref:Probable electron transfer flavoprotein subunit alpha n=1 Tax=Pichia californica TaxID=460514 RepID=A0A9P7BG57_9ASCO|nr:Electron transfer flavoprotein alpha-subunit [[Candida] californica]
MLGFTRRSISSNLLRAVTRNSHTLAFLETSGSTLTPASLSALTAAKEIKKPITALLVGPNAKDAASSVAEFEGIEKVLIQTDKRYEHYLPEQITPLVVSLLQDSSKDISSFIIPASAVGKSVLPRSAAILDIQPLSDIIKVVDPSTFVRPTYAGNALLTVKSTDKIIMTSVRGSAFPPADEKSASPAPIEEIAAVDTDCKTVFISEQLMKSDKPDLSSAKIVVSGGRALKDKATFDSLLNPLAEKLGAAIGASRAAVDDGYCDNSLQVGQTGKIIAPDLYIAIGISGAIQHLAGMKDSKVIVAINKDEEAPIFKIADVGLVGDIYSIIPELTEKL